MRVAWLLLCLTLGLILPAESNMRASSPMMGDGVPRTGPAGPAGPQGEPGATGPKGDRGSQGPAGPAGAPKRVERYTANANTSGVATYTFLACTSSPDVDVILGWTADQMVVGGIIARTLSSATAVVKVSRGTLLLTAGPFQQAPAGTPLEIRVICN